MNEPRIKIMTMADMLDYKWGHKETEEEMAFRRGYFYGVQDVIDALRTGVHPRQLLAYYNNALWDWRFHQPHDKEIKPPAMPEPWKLISKRILARDNYICHYCGNKADTTDHKTPVVHGGTDDDDNLVACCRQCNTKKHTKAYEDFIP